MSQDCETILLVEDNEDDAFALKRGLRKANVEHDVQRVSDGQAAIDYLAGNGKYAGRDLYPMPCLMFLDLKLPYIGGMEVLAWIRQQPDLSSLPVAILSGSDEARDHDSAAALGACDYLVKPASPQRLREVIESACTALHVPIEIAPAGL